MIRGEEIIAELLTFKGFWKASLLDKIKWIFVWIVVVLILSFIWIKHYIIDIPIDLMKSIFKRRR